MVSTLAATLLAALGLSGAPATHAATPSGPSFFVSGHGWGHGVGLAQYGAYGYALHGWTYDQIVAHYFPGTDLGDAPVKRVRVLLAGSAKSVTISSRSPFTVRDGTGKSHKLPAGKQQLGPGLKLKLPASTKALPAPLVFAPGQSPLALGSRSYRGSFRVTGGKAVRVVNVVGLEQYLWGVVPSEMPDRWPAEALQAQAVVARTYALGHLEHGGDFDLYADTRSQVYGGIEAESAPARDAVNATAGQVVLFDGELAQTFFFSSSGGRTANVQDVWGSKSVPYLVSVPDPYDTLSPYHNWGPLRYSARLLGRRLHARGTLLDVRTSAAASGRVRTVSVVGSKGTRTVTGDAVRRLLHLRSTWFTIGTLSLQPPSKPLTYGATAKLSGYSRGIPRVTLESRPYGGTWKPLATLRSRGGRVTATLSPKVTTDYRISSGFVRSGVVRLAVAPAVRIAPSPDRTSVTGVVKPALADAPVQVQRQAGDGWKTVAAATVTSYGAFTASLDLTPGTYRARVIPGMGYAAGISPVLTVVAA
ncbi:MAG TPA: SpoIID/LytB domain-containing protein [Gaiellaceae bacterium]|nr:SpoIID/LytB domain-containing protein [Gaiellaceae bacterium]